LVEPGEKGIFVGLFQQHPGTDLLRETMRKAGLADAYRSFHYDVAILVKQH
jgi:hypothetical protein